jgi:hypothetical protein
MKILLPIIVFLMSVTLSFGQAKKPDIIVKKDNTKIEAVIKEIDETTIKYKRFSNPDGPQYTIKKEEVVTILYANGEVEVVESVVLDLKPAANAEGSASGNSSTKPAQQPTPIAYNVTSSMVGFAAEVQNKSTEDLHKAYQNYKPRSKGGNVFWGFATSAVSVACLTGGIVGFATARRSALENVTRDRTFEEGLTENQNVATGFTAAGVLIGTFSTLIHVKVAKHRKRVNIIEAELRRRGEGVSFQINPVLNSTQRIAGLRLVATF